MTKRITVPFEITAWEQSTWDETDGVQAARAEVVKSFAGELAATSRAQLLMVTVGGEGVAYSAHEVVTGELEGRSGSFVMTHGAGDGEADFAPGRIVPGSGRGGLAGISGRVEFRHDEQGARITLEYELA